MKLGLSLLLAILSLKSQDTLLSETIQAMCLTRQEGVVLWYTWGITAFEVLPDWNLVCLYVEWCWTKLKLKGTRPTYICSLYRPLDGEIQGFLDLLESKISATYNEGIANTVILGDCNIDIMKRGCNKSKLYKDFINSTGLTQLIDEPTRTTLNNRTTIDHIITNREDLYHTGRTLDWGISDHTLIYINRKKQQLPRTISQCGSYRKFDEKQYQKDIDAIDWRLMWLTCQY